MKTKSLSVVAVVMLLSLAITLPPEMLAAPNRSGQVPQGQRAGEVSRVIPQVGIQRASQTITASMKTAVMWQDLVNTQAGARARIALDDGSILNVGSESSLRVVKHDSGAQQTELELTYGKLRSQAVKIARPGGKYEVRTPAGVAGVVGTDFFTSFLNRIMQVIVFEGIVRVCNLAGQCVEVGAGQMTTVREGDSGPPAPPMPATSQLITDAGQSTDVSKGGRVPGGNGGRHLGTWGIIGLTTLIVIPAVVIPLASRTSTTGQTQRTGQCPPQQPTCVP